MLTAGRLYSIQEYPRIIHIPQELCGQGLVMRFGKDAFESPEIGHYLNDLLPGHGVSAMQKEHLMNFIWDMTSGSLAGRVALFENVNSSPAPCCARGLQEEVDRAKFVDQVKTLAGEWWTGRPPLPRPLPPPGSCPGGGPSLHACGGPDERTDEPRPGDGLSGGLQRP